MCEIKNTIKFTFHKGSDKPDIGEAVNFVRSLVADHNQVDAIYRMAEESAIFVKWKSEEAMVHVLTVNPEDLIFHYANGKEAKVYMSHAQDCIMYVRIYGLPPEVADRELASVLGKYGKVKRIVREKIPVELGLNAYTGVRGVYMDVKKEIPTSLHFQNLRGNIFYSGNMDKCFLCKEEGHRMHSCPKRKVRNQPENRRQKKEQGGSSTYADAVTEGVVTRGAVAVDTETGGTKSDSTHQETMEVLEDEMPGTSTLPTDADINEVETNGDNNRNHPEDHPLYKLAVQGITELKKRVEAQKRKEQMELDKQAKKEEDAKIKSPPRKKKNFSLYKK